MSVTIKDFTAGQVAYIVTRRTSRDNDTIDRVIVGKVGRKYVTLLTIGGRYAIKFEEIPEHPYLLEVTNMGHKRMLFPSEKAAREYQEAEDIRKWLCTCFQRRTKRDYTLGQLRAVKAILEGGPDGI